jgi:hypothetical protein
LSLALGGVFSHHDDVEDWEQFFSDKSQRRAENVRRKERAVKIQLVGAAAIFMGIMAAISFLARL